MKILIAGDLVAQNRVREKILEKDFVGLLSGIRSYTAGVDYAILNLETTIESDSESFRAIPKVGPHISSPEVVLDMVKDAGFQCVTMANNHILDYGGAALLHTIRAVEEKGLDHVGAGENLDAASRVLVKNIGGSRLAIVNFCESEFSIAGENEPGAYPLDVVSNVRQIQWARKNADHVVVIVHGGIELYPLPAPRMKTLYRFFVEVGADAVVNHHQHCHSGYEVYQGKPIFYGLGNLLFDKGKASDPMWNYGYLVQLDLDADISFQVIPYSQGLGGPGVSVLDGDARQVFLTKVDDLNLIIGDDAALDAKYEAFIGRKGKQVLFRMSSLRGKFFAWMVHRHLIPIPLGKKKALMLQEYLMCDSHRDIANRVLNKYIGNDSD